MWHALHQIPLTKIDQIVYYFIGFTQLVQQPTPITPNSTSFIYVICVSNTMARIHKARFELRPRFELKPPFVSPNLLLFFTNQVCKKRVKRVI